MSRSFGKQIVALVFLLLSSPSVFAVDMFLTATGVNGESTDATHAGEIEILAWTFGMSYSGGGIGSAGTVNVQDFSFTKYVDSSTVPFLSSLTKGSRFATMRLTIRNSAVPPAEFLIVDMTNVLVSSLTGGGSIGDTRLTENVTFTPGQITITYAGTGAGGAGSAPQVFCYNVESKLAC